MTGWNKAQDEYMYFRDKDDEDLRICAVVLKHTLCHRARYNLLHRQNIYVQIKMGLMYSTIDSGTASQATPRRRHRKRAGEGSN